MQMIEEELVQVGFRLKARLWVDRLLLDFDLRYAVTDLRNTDDRVQLLKSVALSSSNRNRIRHGSGTQLVHTS